MSLAIKFGDSTDTTSVSGAIYFDVVTEYDKQYRGRVTNHPIEAGVTVSDHFISDNPKVRISGVITSVDFSNVPSNLTLDGEQVINNGRAPSAVQVGGLASLKQYLPGVVSQFLPQVPPTIVVDGVSRINHNRDIDMRFKELINGLMFDTERGTWVNRMTPITLYEIEGGVAVAVMENLIATRFSTKEDSETGDSLEFELELEQVRFVTLEEAEAPKAQKGTSVQRQTTPTKEKGTASSTPEPVKERPWSTQGGDNMALFRKELPLYTDPDYSYVISLDRVAYKVRLYYNERMEQWILDLNYANGDPVVLGEAIVEQYPMFIDYATELTGFFWLEPIGMDQNETTSNPFHLSKYYRFFYYYEE